jgi:dienelactone hydrolase
MLSRQWLLCLVVVVSLIGPGHILAQSPGQISPGQMSPGEQQLQNYLRAETTRLADQCLSEIGTLEDWTSRRAELRRQLREMLGLDPEPDRTPLAPQITGTLDQPEFTVEKLHFQSRPGLYVTGNLYLPKGQSTPAPAILYVCGHSKQKEGNTSFGNKTGYQHHGAWYARHGYVCLTIDTIQLGELEGVHHGTHNLNQWWWNARGYTPAGVEAWNGIRAIDYLQTRPEVDPQRIGVTGRSGGGAYSWWIAALDDRVQAAVPVAGITDLQNQVVDGVVDGHCDCMFPVNTYRWDFAQVAALVAPRPLLISNTDKDTIFPLEGVVRIHEKVRRIYRLYGAEKNLGLQITEGPHLDTQELHIHSFRWFHRFLKNEPQTLIEKAAVKFFPPPQLRVFETLPTDEIVTRVAESFVAAAPTPLRPATPDEWTTQRNSFLNGLRDKVFQGWPTDASVTAAPARKLVFEGVAQGLRLQVFDFDSQPHVRLRLHLLTRESLSLADLDLISLQVLDGEGWNEFRAGLRTAFPEPFAAEPNSEPPPGLLDGWKQTLEQTRRGLAWVAPRGLGPDAWSGEASRQIGIRRRLQLLGQTVDGMRVWDIRRAVQTLRDLPELKSKPLWVRATGNSAGLVVYASLFETGISRLELSKLPASHQAGPDLLNVLRVGDLPLTLAVALERSRIVLMETDPSVAEFARQVQQGLRWLPEQLQITPR